jgi:hypothetical protein
LRIFGYAASRLKIARGTTAGSTRTTNRRVIRTERRVNARDRSRMGEEAPCLSARGGLGLLGSEGAGRGAARAYGPIG